MQKTLGSNFIEVAKIIPDRPAIIAEGHTVSYAELEQKAKRIAATIQRHVPVLDPALTGVFAYRSVTAFAGVLGALLAGHGYVPLNRTFPVERTKIMLQRSGCRSVIVDTESASQIDEILEDIQYPILLIFPDLENVSRLKSRFPHHLIYSAADLESAERWCEPKVSPDSIAYLLFTSGSTGIPKGVMVAHRNVIPFIEYMVSRYEINENDRLSQMFDMTFDLSVFDMFVAWEKGACVCCPSQKAIIKPGKFIKDMELTLWFSVPSTLVFMKRFGMLKPNSYPSLRWSLFCGEALPVKAVQSWAQAAPNSILENLYGPTELTIACTLYPWNPQSSPKDCEMDVVPIGYPFPNMKYIVVDVNLKEVTEGEVGELLMSGPQMTLGYLKDPEKTDAAFVSIAGHEEVFYRTGDRVRKPKGNGPLIHLGRLDFQVKIHGHRVELGEIEAVVREESGLDGVVAVGWPITSSGCGGIEVFLEGNLAEQDFLQEKVASRLPGYMTPRKFHFIDRLPLNVNGKFDRITLLKRLEGVKLQ